MSGRLFGFESTSATFIDLVLAQHLETRILHYTKSQRFDNTFQPRGGLAFSWQISFGMQFLPLN